MKALTMALLASLGAACHRPGGQAVPPGGVAVPDTAAVPAPMPGRMMHHGAHGMGGMGAGARPGMGRGAGMRPAADSSPAPAPAVAACPAVTPALVGEGARIFAGAGNCTLCHGPRGSGTPLAPRLSDREWLNVDGSYPALAGLIRIGVPRPKQHAGYMPARGGAPLGDAEVCAVAAYVYSLSH